jgi:hypothetical protein
MRSPFTLFTASLSASTLPATSLANCLLPSSRTRSASSLLCASSLSPLFNTIGVLSRKHFNTGELANVLLLIRLCRYDRSVSLFFSRTSLDGWDGVGDGLDGEGSVSAEALRGIPEPGLDELDENCEENVLSRAMCGAT